MVGEEPCSVRGDWIKIAKKDADIESVRYPEVLESALCFGWIERGARRSTGTTSSSGSLCGGRAASGRGSTVRLPSG